MHNFIVVQGAWSFQIPTFFPTIKGSALVDWWKSRASTYLSHVRCDVLILLGFTCALPNKQHSKSAETESELYFLRNYHHKEVVMSIFY